MRLFVFSLAALIATSGGASAQSVLERVLGQIDGASNLAQVNGTFANIAESVSSLNVVPAVIEESLRSDAPEGTRIFYPVDPLYGPLNPSDMWVYTEDAGTTIYYTTPGHFPGNAELVISENLEIISFRYVDRVTGDTIPMNADYPVDFYDPYGTLSIATEADLAEGPVSIIRDGARVIEYLPVPGMYFYSEWELIPGTTTATEFSIGLDVTIIRPSEIFVQGQIDGSITNIITGVTGATQVAAAGAATATEFVMPTLNLGDIATTALGAVNTGEITLGVNSVVDEARTSTTNAISAVVTQIGGSADTGALVLNVASNASAVNGSINNVLNQVNGSIGNLSTTSLGAVNTGTIVSGVDAAVQGIVGLSGQASSGL